MRDDERWEDLCRRHPELKEAFDKAQETIQRLGNNLIMIQFSPAEAAFTMTILQSAIIAARNDGQENVVRMFGHLPHQFATTMDLTARAIDSVNKAGKAKQN